MQRLISLAFLLACAGSQTTTSEPAESAGQEAPGEEQTEQTDAEPTSADDSAELRCHGERRTDWEQREVYRAVAGCINAGIAMLNGRDEASLRRYAEEETGMTVEGDQLIHEVTIRVGGEETISLEGVEEYSRVGTVANARVRHPLSEGLSPVFADLCELPCVLSVSVVRGDGRLLNE